MTGTAKAGMAAAWLACGLLAAPAGAQDAQNSQWLKAGDCLLFNAAAQPGDTVSWTGDCVDGYASGVGTATFTHNGQAQSFTAIFARGVVPDGHAVTRWGNGWSYQGETVGGRFHGAGILTTDKNDRFDGQWIDGKLSGFGVLLRANGERYAGDWKNNRPNGSGELRHPDGTLIAGTFLEGKLVQVAEKPVPPAAKIAPPANAPFGAVTGKTLNGVDGSSIALNLIEGGLELQVMPVDGNARKTTFTFMTDRMGTVVEDSGMPGAGTSVTGFFRLTAKGVEVRYADGRSAMLSAQDDGVQMALDGESGASCRSWYPAGHVFSEADKKAALNAYASRLGLPVTATATSGCSSTTATAPEGAAPPTTGKPAADKRASVKTPARAAKASYRVGEYKGPQIVSVKPSVVHAIDGGAPISAPSVGETLAALAPPQKAPGKDDASRCLKVDSDGSHWGFRNTCGFAVQFAYCMAGGTGLADCANGAMPGSVPANGFGALTTDNSLKETDANHSFRWIACGGGAGEVVAHLDRFEPPAGRCERTRTVSAN